MLRALRRLMLRTPAAVSRPAPHQAPRAARPLSADAFETARARSRPAALPAHQAQARIAELEAQVQALLLAATGQLRPAQAVMSSSAPAAVAAPAAAAPVTAPATGAARAAGASVGPLRTLDPRSLSMEDRAFLRVVQQALLDEASNVGGAVQQRFGGGSSLYHQGLFGESSRDPALFTAVNQVINDGEYSNELQAFRNDPARVKEYLARGGPLVEAVKAFAAERGLSGAFTADGFRGARPPEWALQIARKALAEGKPVAEGYLRWLR